MMAGEREFEKKMKRLEEIVSILESGDISLEESMKLYREGAQCSSFCREELARARHEVEVWNEQAPESAASQADIASSGFDFEEVPF